MMQGDLLLTDVADGCSLGSNIIALWKSNAFFTIVYGYQC